ncbi:MAG: hypothetical protein F4Y86_15920 [Gammaproteobacteria bacterium]|nr:hypothetical protein [Gammaproteobacteria bacterium]
MTEGLLVDFGLEGLLDAFEKEIGPWARKSAVWFAYVALLQFVVWPPLWFVLQWIYSAQQEEAGWFFWVVGVGGYVVLVVLVNLVCVSIALWYTNRKVSKIDKEAAEKLTQATTELKRQMDEVSEKRQELLSLTERLHRQVVRASGESPE